MEIEEIDHLSVPDPIDQVSNGPAEHKREREREILLILLHPEEQKENDADGQKRNDDEKKGPDSSPISTKNPECSPGVSHVGKIEQPGDHLNLLVKQEGPLNQVLGPLVQPKDTQAGDQRDPIFLLHAE